MNKNKPYILELNGRQIAHAVHVDSAIDCLDLFRNFLNSLEKLRVQVHNEVFYGGFRTYNTHIGVTLRILYKERK